jgi:flagellar hook-associated protein 2
MGGVTLAGVGSGLDLESIISQFVYAERLPSENRLNKRELELNSELSGVGTLKSELSKFQDVLEKLSDASSFGQRQVNFNDSLDDNERSISVTTTTTSASGSFNVEVVNQAKGTILGSGAFANSSATVGSGNLTFGAGSSSFQVNVDGAETLSEIRDKINSAGDNFGVSANIINSDAGAILTFESTITGSANNLTVTSDDDSLASIATAAPTAGAGLTQSQAADDARIRINSQLVSSDTNKFSDSIQGSSIELKGTATAGDTFSFGIETDKNSIETLLEEFVSGYNNLKDSITTLSDPRNGMLAFDPAVRQISSQISTFMSQEVGSATGSLKALYDIGISVNRSGKLEINELAEVTGSKSGRDRLNDALENNFDQITSLLSASDGIAKVTFDYIDQFTKSKGVLSERQTSLGESLTQISDDRITLDERLTSYEQTLRQQYTALDSTIAQYNATKSYISSVLQPTKSSSE